MNRKITLLLVALVVLSLQLTAQNLMDSTIAGYENTSTNFKKAFGNDLWYGNYTDSAFFVTDSMAFAGDYSLCFSDTLSALRKADGTVDTKKAVYFTYFPIAGDTLFAGQYTLSQKVYLEENNSMKSFFTEIGSPVAASVKWDIENSPRGEWVTLQSVIDIEADLDLRSNTGKAARFITRIPADTANTALQTMYIDDHQLMVKEEDTTSTGAYKEGNVFDEEIFGFEKSANDKSDGWYPQKDKGADHYDFTTDKAATGLYSLRLKVDKTDTNVPSVLKVQGTMSEGNMTTIAQGIYDMYLKVFIEENSSITTLNTNWSANKEDDGSLIPTAFKAIAWDLSGVEKGKWVELHRVDTMPAYDRAKVTIQTAPSFLDNTENDVIVFIDDLAAVYKSDYTFVPQVIINNPAQDSVFTATAATVNFSVKDFFFSFSGKVKYTLDAEAPVILDKNGPIEFTDLAEGNHKFTIELVDMTGASLTPAVSASVDFSVSLSASLESEALKNINIYPNPVRAQLFVSAPVDAQLSMYNLLGMEVMQMKQSTALKAYDVSSLRPGTYLLTISHRGALTSTKVQVK